MCLINTIGIIFFTQQKYILKKHKIYPVLQMCLENGITLGYNRAFKHNDHPTEEAIKESIQQAITNEICEWFDFEDVQEK